MKKREFKKALDLNKPSELLSDYMIGKIFLTDKQLDKVIDKKKGTPEEGHGGAILSYANEKN
jgi:hypothetical protein